MLTGTFKAWISDAGYCRTDGATVAANWISLTSGTLDVAIDRSEDGSATDTDCGRHKCYFRPRRS